MDNPLSKRFREFILAPSHTRTISTLVILIIAAAIPLAVLVSQKQQELRQNAATPAPLVCTNNVPADIVIIIDKSGNMVSPDTTRLPQAKAAAKAFVDILSQNTNNRVSLVSFNKTATTNVHLTPLTVAGAASVKTQIDAITAVTNVLQANTCTQCAIINSNTEIATNGRTGIKKVVVLLTDGYANFIVGGTSQTTAAIAEPPALAAVASGHTASGTVFYTIGLGSSINTVFLTKIANITGGKYYASPTSTQLTSIYTQISQVLGKGSIVGTVFNDLNSNHVFDTTEPGLANWVINLFAGTNTTPQTSSTTDASGIYTIQGLCDGTYNLKEIVQTGWTQTLPTPSSQGYTITIANGNNLTKKDFGNVHATASSSPSPSPTPSHSPSRSPSPIPTSTPTPASTLIPTPASTLIPTPGATVSPGPSSTFTPTPTPTPGSTSSPNCLCVNTDQHIAYQGQGCQAGGWSQRGGFSAIAYFCSFNSGTCDLSKAATNCQ